MSVLSAFRRIPLAAYVTVQLLSGLFLQLTIIVQLGAGRQSDIFVAAQAVPVMLFAILYAPLQNIWQPALVEWSDQPAAWCRSLESALGQCSLVFGATALLLGLTAGLWVPVLVPGFTAEEQVLTAELTVVLMAASFFNGHGAVYALGLRTRSRFVLPEALNVATTAGAVLACIVFVPKFGVSAAAYVLLGRSVATVLALWCFNRFCLPKPFRLFTRDANWRSLFFLSGSGSICEAIVLVDRHLGSLAVPGGMTIYSLAKLGMASLASIFDRTLVGPFAAHATRAIIAGDAPGAGSLYRELIRKLAWLSAATGVVLLLSYALLPWALQHTMGMGAQLAIAAWWICMGLLGFLVFAPSAAAHTAMLFALGDRRTAALVNLLSFVVEAALKFLMFHWLGLAGLAIATSLSLGLNFLLCRRVAMKRLAAL